MIDNFLCSCYLDHMYGWHVIALSVVDTHMVANCCCLSKVVLDVVQSEAVSPQGHLAQDLDQVFVLVVHFVDLLQRVATHALEQTLRTRSFSRQAERHFAVSTYSIESIIGHTRHENCAFALRLFL